MVEAGATGPREAGRDAEIEAIRPSMTAPLTERLLDGLPGPRWVWIGAWVLLAPLRILALVGVLELTDQASASSALTTALGQWALGYVVLIALWACPALWDRVDALRPTLRRIAPTTPPSRWFDRMLSARGPLVLTALAVAVSVPSTFVEFGAAVAVMDIALLGLLLLPVMALVWEYAMLLIGLDRLGRAELVLDRFPEDRALGLGPVGGAAMAGFWPLLIAGVPFLLLAGGDLTTFVTSMVVLAATVALFVLSMVRLHGQMRAAKAGYVAMTRGLVAEAYGPVRERTDLATLETHASALGAAQALADRADKLLEWPIDERMVTSITVVVTGVVTSLVVRVLVELAGG